MDPLLELLPDVPEDLAELSDEQVESLLAQARAVTDKITTKDADTVGEADAAAILAAATKGVEIIETLASEAERRDEAKAEADTQLAELREKAGLEVVAESDAEETPETPAPETPAEGEEEETTPAEGETPDEEATPAEETPAPDAETVEEPVAVAASAAQRRKPRLPRAEGRAKPTPSPEAAPVTVVAAAEGMGMPMGSPVHSLAEIGQGMRDKQRAIYPAPSGSAEKIPLFRFISDVPEERQLFPEDVKGNQAKIDAMAMEVVAAGICAPVTPRYELEMISTAVRPMRDSLASFNAARGGISFAASPKLSAVSTAVGRITNAQAVAGGSPAVKGCQVVACPAFSEVDVAAIYHCLQSDNLNARIYPEQVDQFAQLVAAAHASLAETAILDAMVTASTAVTAGQAIGAMGDLVKHFLTAAAGIRNRHRMDPESPLHVWAPAWTLDLLLGDQIRSTFDRFKTRAEVEAYLRVANVNITWYVDSPSTGTTQKYAAQGAGGLLDFPSVVRWFIAPEGSFLFIDGGELDLGLVRDSTLNSTNQYQIFAETWENVAFVGVEALGVTSALCDTGQTGNQVAIACAS